MGTPSIIAAKFDGQDGRSEEIVSTYCHFDGYLSNMGERLMSEYADEDGAFMLADAGYLSCVPHRHDFYYVLHSNEDVPSYSESEQAFLIEVKNSGIEHVYLYKDGEWYYLNTKNIYGNFRPLTNYVN